MNERFFLGFEDNFEVDSRMIENGMVSEMYIADLSDAEKAEIFELEFTMEDIPKGTGIGFAVYWC